MDLQDKRILIIKQSSLGDIVHTLPVAHALKRCFPTCHIGWVAEQGFSALVSRDKAVDHVYPIHIPSTSSPDAGRLAYLQASFAMVHALRQLWNALHQDPYDLILDLHASFRSGLFALMNPGGMRVGFGDARELNTLFQHRLIAGDATVVHAVEKNLLFCDFLECPADEADFYLCTSPKDEQGAGRFLEAAGLGGDAPFVYVNPTARWQSKFWFSLRWSELSDQLLEAGIGVVFGGSGADRVYIKEITGRMHRQGAVAAGQLSLTESVALMKRASVYVGLDTGPMHMAAMTGIPVVALFGPTHPERVGPYRVRQRIVRAQDLDCLCCRKRVCDHPRCMEGITVAAVFDQVMALLADPSSSAKAI